MWSPPFSFQLGKVFVYALPLHVGASFLHAFKGASHRLARGLTHARVTPQGRKIFSRISPFQ